MKKAIRFLALVWLAALLRLTVFRDGCFSHGLFSGRIEWDAFAYYAKLVRVGNWRYFTYLFVGNLAWFVPVGMLVWLRESASAGRETRPLRRARREAHGKTDFLSRGAQCAPLHKPRSVAQQCVPLPEMQRTDGRQIAGATSADGRVPFLRALLWGFLLSLFVETGQFVLGSGVSELDDLILNSCGAVLGFGIVCIFDKMRKNMKSPIDKKPHDIDNRR